MALDEFFDWYRLEPRPGFSKAAVNAWRVTLDERGLGSSSIIVRMSAIRKLAVEATDNGLLAPELAAGIARVKSAKSIGVRGGNWLSLKQAQALLNAPDITTTKGLRARSPSSPCCSAARYAGPRCRRSPMGAGRADSRRRRHRRTAREYAGAVGAVPEIFRPCFLALPCSRRACGWCRQSPECGKLGRKQAES
jgi:hypothetical protein